MRALTGRWWLLWIVVVAQPLAAQTAQWVGSYQLGPSKTPLIVTHDAKANQASADLPLLGMRGLEITGFESLPGRLRFQLPSPDGVMAFDAPVLQGSATGAVVRGAEKGTFTLIRTESLSPSLIAEYAGSYELAAGHVLDIGPMDELGGQLVFLDQKTLKEGALYALSPTELVSGETLGVPHPFAIRAEVVRDRRGAIAGLRWSGEGVTRRLAKKIRPHLNEEVTVTNGDVSLRGVLSLPAGKGPHPAVVFAHGAGNTTRNVGMWNMFFVRIGFAVLSLDKRGAGASTGDWHMASMDDLAGDWLAGIEMLKKRADIDPKRIGVHGSSQGGWTAPIMAARSKDVAFVIVRAGSGTTVRDTMLHEIAWSVRDAGFAESDVAEAVAASASVFDLTSQAAPWGEIAAITLPAQKKPWANEAWPIWGSEAGWGRVWNKSNAHYDSAVALRDVHVPVLWFFADNDHNVPTAVSEPRVAEALRAAGNQDVTIRVLRDAGHGFTQTKTGRNADFAIQSRMVPGYFSEMEHWLRQRFLKRK